jgi:alpha-1,2-mannosyltransferase
MLTDGKRNSNAGGGGERVLWTAIALMQRTEPDVISVVYSGDAGASKEQIIAKAKVRVVFSRACNVSATYRFGGLVRPMKARFDITLAPQSLHFVFLESRWLVEDSAWPRFTLLGQSLGSMYLAWEALSKFVPDLYIGVLRFLHFCSPPGY